MKKTFLNLAFISAFCFGMNAQVKIGNNPERIDVNAILELESKVGGVLLPRLSLRNSISSFPLSYHVKGMMVYNLTDTADVQEGIYVNNGSKWIYSGSNSKFGSVGGDLRSDDNIIQVANGAGALLKDVKIKINDTILAGRMTAKPYSDSMISAVARNADKSPLKESFIKVISDNVSSQPLIGSIARATDASPLRDSLLNLVADNASNAPIVGALARATDAAPLRDS
nr:hypothetical protein [Chitinophagales bacterium]